VSDWDEETQTEPGEVPDASESIRRTNASLIVITGSGVGTLHKLPMSDAIIGRGQRAEVRLIDDGVSRAHAKIRSDGTRLVIEDLGSRNGTFVNGKRLDRSVTLFDGDKIQIGRTTVLRFSYHDLLDESFHEQMLQSALRDSATKLFNKRYFMDRLDGEFKFALRHNSALSVLMVDLDHFKNVNDRFGHVTGDAVLANVAQVIARSVRNEDVVARFGGEEIGIILRAIGVDQAVVLAERLRRLVEAVPTPTEDHGPVHVSVSIGVAGIPDQPFEVITDLINAADQALYRAKHGGRNRVAR
jgi:two-component system, cell cycle response regulator